MGGEQHDEERAAAAARNRPLRRAGEAAFIVVAVPTVPLLGALGGAAGGRLRRATSRAG